MKRLGSCVGVALVFSVLTPAAADDGSTWQPGEQVTANVQGEPEPHHNGSGKGDGVYGRLDGDLTLAIGLGAELDGETRPALIGRALYYQFAGIVLGYSDAFASDRERRRVALGGIELRPLFLWRWSTDRELNRAFWDLTLDSLSVSLGVYRAEQGKHLEPSTEHGLELALGFGVPLLAKARGPWLEARGFVRNGLHDGDGVLLALSWNELVLLPTVH